MKLNHKPQLLPATLLVIGLCVFLASCSKDTDLLSEYVTNGENSDFASTNIIDDNFNISYGTQEVLNVLENDNIIDPLSTNITSVSDPLYGSVTLKEDNTLVYYAPGASTEETETVVTSSEGESETDNETDEESAGSNTTEEQDSNNTTEEQQTEESTTLEDSFTYTTETEDEDGEITTETGTVNIIIENSEDNTSHEISNENYLFTNQAKALLKERFENGYIAGTGFHDDISEVITNSTTFTANPSEFRPIFGPVVMSQSYNGTINNSGHTLHTTAVYAYAIDNMSLANTVASELLAIVKANNLYTTYWNSSNSIRWDNTEEQLWVQASTAKKLKNSYYFIKNLQNVLSGSEKEEIEAWFKRFAELGFDALKSRMASYFGNNWENNGISKFNNEGVYPIEYGSTTPIQDASKNDLFTIAWAQDHFNNRNWDVIAYLHSWAVVANDLEMETWCREFFKISIKYGMFSDGTWWEMQRANDADPTKGVYYGWVSLGAMVQIAHLDASGNHFPNDRLYDYKTSEGILFGSTNITTNGFQGTSTTDGTTQKSLLTFLTAQAKYLRSASYGGWNDIRFFENSSGELIPLSTVGKRQPSSVPAMANLYYKSNSIKDLYTYNTSVGYPQKVRIKEGYMAGVSDEDSGPWGNLIFGSMWYGQENNFFN